MVNGTNKEPELMESGIRCGVPLVCHNQRCSETREMVNQLRKPIEVLEAELRCLRAMTVCGKSGDKS